MRERFVEILAEIWENRVADVLLGRTGLPTTLLAEFYLDTDTAGTAALQKVRPEHVGLLYDSLLSSESSRRRVRLSIEGADPQQAIGMDTDHADGEFELFSIDREEEGEYEPQIIKFALELTAASTLSFRRYIRDVHLTVPCTVELGAGVAEFKIGSSVYVSASRIRVGSEALVVEKVSPKYDEYTDTSVTLEALNFESPMLNGNPTVYTQDFSVSWPSDELFPWRQYRQRSNHIRV